MSRANFSDWEWIPSPRFWRGRLDNYPIFGVVQHYTAAGNGRALAKWLASSSSVSTHVIICRDGHVIQQVNFEDRAFHAGEQMDKGFWRGNPQPTNVNHFTIGLENSNYGALIKDGGDFYTLRVGERGEEKGIIYPRHLPTPVEAEDHLGRLRWWEPYSDELVAANIEVLKRVVDKYKIAREDIVGHSDVSPHRKLDPGPLWPSEYVLGEVYGSPTGAAPATVSVKSDPGETYPDMISSLEGRGDNADGENPEWHYDYVEEMSMVERVHTGDEGICE